MKTPLPGIRVMFAVTALLGAFLAGCDKDEQPPRVPREVVPVQFEVTVPADTPAGAGVAVVGDHPALGNGRLPGLALKRDENGHFQSGAELPVGATISYTLWLTSPSAEELDASGLPPVARTFTVEDRDGIVESPTVSRWSEPIDAAKPPITFVVEVPANTPAGAEIWLSGNQPELGNWNGAGVKLTQRAADNRYVTRIAFSSGTNLEFKVTRGGWGSVEKSPEGDEVGNHKHPVTEPAKIDIQVGSWADDMVPPKPKPDTLTGNIKYHQVDGSSVGLKNRQLIVWLPPGYDAQTTRSFPVLYMHDGQNVMNTKTAFAGEWGVDETAQRLIEAGQMEPIIIVGVYNAEADRIAEYTHVATTQHGGGKADDYGKLLVQVVKPLIDSAYRTRPEAEFTGLAGSSLGGLVSMYLGMTRSNTFTRLGVISPSVWWGQRDIVTRVNELPARLPLRIWLDIGTREGDSLPEYQDAVNDTRALRDALTAKGWVLDTDLKYLEAEGAEHNEAAWAARTEQILKFLYPPVP